jgi:hypothetical protein
MVARHDKQALPTRGLPKAPTLLQCFLEALAKREDRDQRPQASVDPAADRPPATPEPFPVVASIGRPST